ncbi:rhomboid family intramembrane serine protease [Paraflavitalea sp. CAU 1676]|uniref:rhomboid family intramembrane serine protease n=1 Tax=Paraflavitalea sp. CAU 1676 TaxID=3032598 RepID=UPI0023DBA0EC|nr:rhomboid family intramembrane serine protease [Paraflavitalea sp. CAU 1676]MDF2186863.1 rhomboid family intramembrane serine protease [Paraflavitalea sp. CAU 1676]
MLREDRYRKRILLGQDGNSLVLLLAILAIVFCLFKFLWIVYWMSGSKEAAFNVEILHWFTLPSDLGTLATRPWTLLTYMFMHEDPMHMIGNVLWLWAFGYILQDLAGPRKIIPLFIYGGLAGGIFYVISFNLIPVLTDVVKFSSLIGASAGVMAIAIATTAMAPGYRIFPMINGGIPLWVLTLIFVVLDFAMVTGSNTGGHLAHLAGAAIGYVFVVQLKRGRDWGEWMNRFFDWINNLFNPDKRSWKKTAKEELHYESKGTQPFKRIPNITQKRIDEILDKINQQGYRYLTEEEKDILKRASEDEEL